MKARQTAGEYQAAAEEFISKCGHRWTTNTSESEELSAAFVKTKRIHPQLCAYQSPACKMK